MGRSKGGGRSKRRASSVFPVVNKDAAGIDAGSQFHFAAVPLDRSDRPVRRFSTMTGGLRELADWLLECRIRTVAIEATGVYWIPVFQILESRGLEVVLIDPRSARSIGGKKSDVVDCQWIQQLHASGLLRASFRPPDEIVELRGFWRHRRNLLEQSATQIHLVQKALDQMNVRLHNVVTDVMGETGAAILRAILGGEREPATLARLRNYRCHKTESEIAAALAGDYRAELVFQLRQAVEAWDFFHRQIEVCDVEIRKSLEKLAGSDDGDPPAAGGARKPRRSQPRFDVRSLLLEIHGVDLCEIDGIDEVTALTLLSEVGTDLRSFPSVKHFASWLHLAPGTRISGGRALDRRTKRGASRAGQAFRLAAQSLARSNSYLGATFRRLRARLGPQKTVTAVAHKLARIYYTLVKTGVVYADPGPEADLHRNQETILRNLRKRAKSLGMQLIPDQPLGQTVS